MVLELTVFDCYLIVILIIEYSVVVLFVLATCSIKNNLIDKMNSTVGGMYKTIIQYYNKQHSLIYYFI